MKKILLITLLLQGCVYSTKSVDEKFQATFDQFGKVAQLQSGYLNVLVNEVFKKKISECKAIGLGLDLTDLKCIADPKNEKVTAK